MPTIVGVIQSEAERRWGELIATFLPAACVRRVVLHLRASLHTDAAATTADWSEMDDPVRRVRWLRTELTQEATALALTVGTDWSTDFDAALRAEGYSSERPKRLARHLEPVVVRIIADGAADAALAVNPFPGAWTALADELAGGVFAASPGDKRTPEWSVLNRLVLASFFASCDLERALPAQNSLTELRRSVLSVRGSLVRLPEKVESAGIVDVRPAVVALGRPVTISQRSLSPLLAACHDESAATAVRRGIAQRVLPPDNPVPSHVQAELQRLYPGQDPVRLMCDVRATTYQQYNFTILAYAALCGVEQLLRGLAERSGVSHAEPSGWLAPVPKWLPGLGLPAELAERVTQLYSTDHANVRNRVMHGGLLEVEGQRTQIAARAIAGASGPNRQAYSAENVANLSLQLLEDIDVEAALHGGLSPAHFGWVGAKTLSPLDISFVATLPNPIFWGLERAEEWRRRLFRYLSWFCPAANLSAKFGLHGWARHYRVSDSFVQVLFLSLTFETLYRLTAHLLGESILQMSATRGGTQRVFRYRMLDDTNGGLCSDRVFDKILSYVPAADCEPARQTFRLAVKTRDAFAHGAVPGFSPADLAATAHVFVHSLDVLTRAGLRHLTEQAAYFNWVNSGRKPGNELTDWLYAERVVNARLTS